MQAAIEQLIIKLGHTLSQKQLKLATAESCTGGGLSYCLTSVPGSSAWFECGFVTYSNAAKVTLLNIDIATLEAYGAVSAETAAAMAAGALQQSAAQISIAITGIAGPDGGTKEKPVGTIWIAWEKKEKNAERIQEKHIQHAPQNEIQTEHFIFSGTRQEIREKTIIAAIEKLLVWV